jgi:hypothetical protein
MSVSVMQGIVCMSIQTAEGVQALVPLSSPIACLSCKRSSRNNTYIGGDIAHPVRQFMVIVPMLITHPIVGNAAVIGFILASPQSHLWMNPALL